jgi:glucokinase
VLFAGGGILYVMILAGIDIGGTKCAVSLGKLEGPDIRLIAKKSFATLEAPSDVIERIIDTLNEMMKENSIASLASIGISCGGPLDSKNGIILSPPNLPGWDEITIVSLLREFFGIPVGLQNDANACALAEWKWGAGRGCSNMIFLTFGTGMGAGLILNGRLYAGTNDMAGEVGHMRMEKTGPVGYGKAGSFEGYCSGGGIAKLAQTMAWNQLQIGKRVSFCQTREELASITAQKVGEAAVQGDKFALEIFDIVGKQLGRGIAVLVDILNPERIIIGSNYGRQQSILEPIVMEELRREALPYALSVCQVMPAGLREQVGDFASLSVALHTIE